jgi:hypothetical protein
VPVGHYENQTQTHRQKLARNEQRVGTVSIPWAKSLSTELAHRIPWQSTVGRSTAARPLLLDSLGGAAPGV